MKAPNVDLVLVIDASDSMRPCINQLRQHLRELIKPLQGYSGKIRFGLVALSASAGQEYHVQTLVGSWWQEHLYGGSAHQHGFFTDSPDNMLHALDKIEVSANEHNLLALDIALDFPFGPTSTTKRIVALFSDEPFEAGVERQAGTKLVDVLVDKIHKRRVKLFCAVPYSEVAQRLSEANGSEIEAVDANHGLANVDFRALLAQMGKSISVSALQGGLDEVSTRPLFGQDKWVASSGYGWNSRDSH